MKASLFSAKPVSIKCANYTFYAWRPVRSLPNELGRQLGGFFSSNKSAPANGKKGFQKSSLPKNDESRGFL